MRVLTASAALLLLLLAAALAAASVGAHARPGAPAALRGGRTSNRGEERHHRKNTDKV